MSLPETTNIRQRTTIVYASFTISQLCLTPFLSKRDGRDRCREKYSPSIKFTPISNSADICVTSFLILLLATNLSPWVTDSSRALKPFSNMMLFWMGNLSD